MLFAVVTVTSVLPGAHPWVSVDISGNARVPVLQLIYNTSGTLKIYPNFLFTALLIYITTTGTYMAVVIVDLVVSSF